MMCPTEGAPPSETCAPAPSASASRRARGGLLFFPSADADGTPTGERCAGEPAPPDSGEKWIAQVWLHERPYDPALPPGNSHADATPLVREYAAEHALIRRIISIR